MAEFGNQKSLDGHLALTSYPGTNYSSRRHNRNTAYTRNEDKAETFNFLEVNQSSSFKKLGNQPICGPSQKSSEDIHLVEKGALNPTNFKDPLQMYTN